MRTQLSIQPLACGVPPMVLLTGKPNIPLAASGSCAQNDRTCIQQSRLAISYSVKLSNDRKSLLSAAADASLASFGSIFTSAMCMRAS